MRLMRTKAVKRIAALTASAAMIIAPCSAAYAEGTENDRTEEEGALSPEEILASMTLDDKISQMIMPCVRYWNEENMTDLSAYPELEEALRAHQYGGIILFASNVADPGQTATLVQQLQVNNLMNTDRAVNIPYFMAADEEGGIVLRLNRATRMTGNMAIGATGEKALENAENTGLILGSEMAAAGFNVDFAPDVDVNNNPANPVIGTRAFSDDPDVVAALGTAWARGLSESGVIATFKHFPGHGDTAVDSHIGTPSVEKTYDEIRKIELVPFEAAIAEGADMIMTAHITYPLIDDEVVFGDGVTKGYYPATMSKKMITDILRGDLGYDGVVVTDALEMDAIRTAGLVPGEENSVEYQANVAEKVINAGIDILLIPCDLNSPDAVSFYDDYIGALAKMTEDGTIPKERIDESVLRILSLKEKYGILNMEYDIDSALAEIAWDMLGSAINHETEMEIAREAITLLKNEDETLPLEADGKKTVLLGRQAEDAYTLRFAISQLQELGIIDKDALIDDLAFGTKTGDENSDTKITIDYYYDPKNEENKLHYTDELKKAIGEADAVVGLTKTSNIKALQEESELYQGIANAMKDAHDAGARFVLLSDNLPYDAARFEDADAILLAYMGAGMNTDPTEKSEQSGNLGAINANVIAAVHMLFGDGVPVGTLPVDIPEIDVLEDGSVAYSDRILYERGFGLTEPEAEEGAKEAA